MAFTTGLISPQRSGMFGVRNIVITPATAVTPQVMESIASALRHIQNLGSKAEAEGK